MNKFNGSYTRSKFTSLRLVRNYLAIVYYKRERVQSRFRSITNTFHLHLFVPLVCGCVEVAPAGSILPGHDTVVKATQHRHHIVLDGACHGEV